MCFGYSLSFEFPRVPLPKVILDDAITDDNISERSFALCGLSMSTKFVMYLTGWGMYVALYQETLKCVFRQHMVVPDPDLIAKVTHVEIAFMPSRRFNVVDNSDWSFFTTVSSTIINNIHTLCYLVPLCVTLIALESLLQSFLQCWPVKPQLLEPYQWQPPSHLPIQWIVGSSLEMPAYLLCLRLPSCRPAVASSSLVW